MTNITKKRLQTLKNLIVCRTIAHAGEYQLDDNAFTFYYNKNTEIEIEYTANIQYIGSCKYELDPTLQGEIEIEITSIKASGLLNQNCNPMPNIINLLNSMF